MSLRAVKNELISPVNCPLDCGSGPGPCHDGFEAADGKANVEGAADDDDTAMFAKEE